LIKQFKPIGSILLTILGSLLIAACTGTTPAVVTATPSGPQVFTWDHSPTAAVFQMSRAQTGELYSYALNRLPLCTLFGDGRLVWTTSVPLTGQQVLQVMLNEADTHAFLAYAISDQHFFSVPDYAAHQPTPSGLFSIDTMTIALVQGTYTTRSYGAWPKNEYQTLLDKCTHLTDQPTLYQPTGGWLSVEPLTGTTNDSRIVWGADQPFQLAALSGKPPIWISGDIVQIVWRILRRGVGAVQWQEANAAYRVNLQVPSLSAGAPPPPAITPTPFPSVTPLPPGTFVSQPQGRLPPVVTQIPLKTSVAATAAATAIGATSATTLTAVATVATP